MNSLNILKWHSRYMHLAAEIAKWSKDPSTKVGAVIVGPHGQIVSQGYNGFPRGVLDSAERYLDRETKYKYIVHAELNAILNALYNGASVKDCTLYVYALPVCSECAKAIIQSGIKKIIIQIDKSSNRYKKWYEQFMNTSAKMFNECGITYTFLDNGELKHELSAENG